MRIAVIGSGNVGGTLGTAWARRGHTVRFGTREPGTDRASTLRAAAPGSEVTDNASAAAPAEVVVLCTPWPDARDAVRSCGELRGKILIDCTNPLKPDFSGLALGFDTSAAEQIAGWASGARVFKAMNQIGANHMDAPAFEQGQPVMFVCGPDDGKPTVLGLVRELGFDVVDAGPLPIARLLEPYAMLWIHLALRQGLGRDIAFALLRK